MFLWGSLPKRSPGWVCEYPGVNARRALCAGTRLCLRWCAWKRTGRIPVVCVFVWLCVKFVRCVIGPVRLASCGHWSLGWEHVCEPKWPHSVSVIHNLGQAQDYKGTGTYSDGYAHACTHTEAQRALSIDTSHCYLPPQHVLHTKIYSATESLRICIQVSSLLYHMQWSSTLQEASGNGCRGTVLIILWPVGATILCVPVQLILQPHPESEHPQCL